MRSGDSNQLTKNTYPISTVRTVGSDGIPDSINVFCYLHGVVITPSYRRDESGYSVKVFGEVRHYNGHIQLQTSGDSIWVLDSNKMVPTPMAAAKLDETTESKLLLFEDWEIIDTTGWPTANYGNYDITNGTDTFLMRMDGDRSWAANMPKPPVGKFCFVGVGGQFDQGAPRFGGYQILPRDTNDFIVCPGPCVAPIGLKNANLTVSSADISWTSGGSMWNVGWSLNHTSTAADIVDSVMGITTNPYTITGLIQNQHYHVYVQEVCGFKHSMWSDSVMFTTLPTGIEDVNGNKTSLVAFPNPNNTGEVRFNMEVSVTVRNILGQTVKTGNKITSLNISDLESGVYFIQSEEGDTLRLIVE